MPEEDDFWETFVLLPIKCEIPPAKANLMPGKISHFWQELKRRRVTKVIAMYAATAFIIMEGADIMLPRLGLPDWTVTLVIALLIVGFPIAIILSWIFDVTPEGVIRTEQGSPPAEEPHQDETKGRGLKLSDGIIAVLFVVVCILLYPKVFRNDKFREIRDADGRITVAILPFENLTGESANDFWQNGISEYLINDLGSSNELSVISSQVMQEVLGSTKQVSVAAFSPAIARETAGKINASTYITGNFMGPVTNLSVLLNLVSTGTGEVVWSCRVEGDLGNRYQQLLGQLADTLRNYLEIKAIEGQVSDDLSRAFPRSSEAYRHYINGLKALVASDVQTARTSLHRAIEIDSTFTLAAFYLAWAYNMNSPSVEELAFWTNRAHEMKQNLPPQYQNWIDMWYAAVNEDMDGMLQACRIMERSDIQSRFFWFDLGATYYAFLQEFERAVSAFRKVELLSEHWNDVWELGGYYGTYALALLETGGLDEMNRIAETGLSIDPENLFLVESMGARSLLLNDTAAFARYMNLLEDINRGDVNPEASNAHDTGEMYRLAKDYRTAKEFFRRAYELDPGRNWSHYLMIRSELMDNGDPEKWLGSVNAELDRDPENTLFIWLKGYVLHRLGRNEEALALMKESDDRIWYNGELKSDIKAVEQALGRQEQ